MSPAATAPPRPSGFGVDVLTLVTGTTIAQIITILASPIITRLYGPETFGLLALFTSITSIIGVIVCLRYELAIMLPASDKEAANVFGLSIIFAIIVSLLSVPALMIFQQTLLQSLKAPQLAPFLWLIPVSIFLGGIFLALNSWNTRTRNFHRLSIARVISTCSSTGTQLGMGYYGYASGGTLIGASILGQIVSTVILGLQIIRDHLSFFRQNISWKGMSTVLERYSNFPKYDMGSSLLNTISWQIPLFFLAYFFSTAIVGYYSLGMMIIQLPMSFIGAAIGQVFFQRASEAFHQNRLALVASEAFHILLKISILPMLVLAIAGEDLFMVIFGASWGEAGVYVQILSIWAIFWFISSPISTILSVTQKLKMGLKLTLLNFSTRLISLVIGGLMGSVVIALALFSLSGVVVYGLACFVFLKIADVSYTKTLQMILKGLLTAVPFLIPLAVLKILAFSPIMMTLAAIAVGIAYYLYIFLTDPDLRKLIGGMRG